MSTEKDKPDYWRIISRKPYIVGSGGEHAVFGGASYGMAKINELFIRNY